jgi:hypothetical protein
MILAQAGTARSADRESADQRPDTLFGTHTSVSVYTARFDADTAAAFDGLALAARRKLGRKVDKSELVRAFITMAADDGSLRDEVIEEVRRRGGDAVA